MRNTRSSICVIPSRSQGDSINNLNFLNVGNQMLLELTINSAMKSNLFKKIFVIFDNINHKNLFEKKYNIFGIVDKKKNVDFTKLIKKYSKRYFDNCSSICVLFPNSPFKNYKTIKNMHARFTREKLNFMVSGCIEKKGFYYNEKNQYKKIFKLKKNSKNELFYISGGINFFKKNFNDFDRYLENINKKNIYKVNYHEGFSIYTVYDLILAGTINDIDPSIFRNLLQKNIN